MFGKNCWCFGSNTDLLLELVHCFNDTILKRVRPEARFGLPEDLEVLPYGELFGFTVIRKERPNTESIITALLRISPDEREEALETVKMLEEALEPTLLGRIKVFITEWLFRWLKAIWGRTLAARRAVVSSIRTCAPSVLGLGNGGPNPRIQSQRRGDTRGANGEADETEKID